ncbi:MAG: 4Fe-4S dicluster domain-containing protein [Nitrososphaerales archaeon]
MPMVYNWQIGREMFYPFEGHRPKKQFAATFNINRCIGCQTCTMACKSTWTFSKGQEHMWWNNVETKPYGGYPHFWDIAILNMLGDGQTWVNGVYKGKTIYEAAPEGKQVLGVIKPEEDWRFPNWYQDVGASTLKEGESFSTHADLEDPANPVHENFFHYLQRICNHCTYPSCGSVCPRKAIYKRPEDGIVLIDQSRCRGYRECVTGCPYGKSLYNPVTRVSEKCIACYPRVEQGIITRCIAACVGKIRLQGWVKPPDEAVPDHPMDYMVHVAKIAKPLYPQYGCEGNIYYIPPRWVPKYYRDQMFGPGTDESIKNYLNPSHETLGVLQLFGTTQKIIESFRVTENHAIGYDTTGHEVIRVPIQEQFIIRPAFRQNDS